MDYPKSVPNVGLVDGQFADENPATGQVGSLIPSAWGNAVTQELLNVIKAAGFVPAEDQTNQLLKAIQGLVSQGIKNSVRVATTGAIALSGVQTIDAIVLVAGDRVLVKNQASGAQNGIYVVATGAWVRALDADESVEVKPGMLVGVDAGTVNGGSVWRLSNATPPTLGTSALTFEQVFGKTGVVAGSYKSVTVDAAGRVTAGDNPTTLAGYGIADAYTKAFLDNILGFKANLSSPAFTGIPTATTAAPGTNTNQLATTAFIQAALAALVNSSPAALDTLNELAVALGNDPNFATTITNALAGKVAVSDKAVQLDAETGTNDTKWMTPLRVFQAIGKVVKQATESAFGWAKVATQAQVDTGSDDATIVTPKKLLNGVASSNGVTSYRKTASWQDGGTIRSSGTAQTTSTGRVVVTLPLAFADTNYVITCSSQSAGAGFPGWSVEVNKGARTTSTFEVGTFTSSAASAANVPFQWTAEGKAP